MRRARRIGAGVAVATAAIVAVAYATTGPMGLTVNPAVAVIQAPGNGSTTLDNGGTQPVFISKITTAASCDSSFMAMPPSFTLAVGSGQVITFLCPTTLGTPMKRCTFTFDDGQGMPIISFEGVCEYAAMANLTPDMTTIDFGSVAVGTTVTKTVHFNNPSPTTITELSFESTDPLGDFLVGSPCNPHARECDATVSPISQNGTGSFDVACSPQSVGAFTATLFMDTDTHQLLSTPIALTCTGTAVQNPVIAINPSSIDAGSVDVLGMQGSGDLVITNAGGGTLQITGLQIVDTGTGAALDWTSTVTNTCSIPCNLAGSEELDVHVVFDPSAIGVRDASLVVSYIDTADRTMPVPLDGIGLGATLSLVGNNPMIDFGTVQVGSASPVTFQLANAGNRNLTDVTLGVSPTGPPFSLSAMTTMVSDTQPTTITATCMPTAAGMFMTTFTADAPDTFMSPPISIAAKCQGSTQALFSMPTTISLGEVRTGTAAVHVTVMALGTGVTIESAALEIPDAPNLVLTPPSLPAATPVSLDLVVTPTTDGDLTNHLDVTASPNSDMLQIPITGKVVTASVFAPATATLGTFCVNQPTTGQAMALASTGTATVELGKPVLALASSPFELELTSPSSYPSALPAMTDATVEITPKPQTVAGTQQDDLVWSTDVAGEMMVRTTLSAVFVDDGGAIAPSALAFGKVVVSHVDRPNGQRVTLQNCGTAAIQLSSQLDSPFTIEGTSVPTVLAPSESATISVGFHPQMVGTYSGNLTLTIRDASPLVVALTGEGVNAASDGDAGPSNNEVSTTSFYACGCHSFDAAGGVPLALVWLVLRRRRTR